MTKSLEENDDRWTNKKNNELKINLNFIVNTFKTSKMLGYNHEVQKVHSERSHEMAK